MIARPRFTKRCTTCAMPCKCTTAAGARKKSSACATLLNNTAKAIVDGPAVQPAQEKAE